MEQSLHIVSSHYLELASRMMLNDIYFRDFCVFFLNWLTAQCIWPAFASNSELHNCITFLRVKPGERVYHFFVCLYRYFFKLCIFLTKDFAPINWIAILLLPFILSIEILPNCIDTKEDKALFVPLLKSANNPVSDSADVLVLVCCILATIRILSTVLLTPPQKRKKPFELIFFLF